MPGSAGDEVGYLTPTIAQEIAGDTSAIIGLNIIITDAAGIVLGSGDQTRVGTFHEASVDVVAHQRVESHNAEQAARLQGVRPGMTLPIVHKDTVVGTVGITGTPDQVSRFGQLVKRQTEILLEEAGSELPHIVKTTIYLTDRAHRESVYQVVGRWLKGVYPCQTGLIVAGLAKPEMLMEIDVEAVIPAASSS